MSNSVQMFIRRIVRCAIAASLVGLCVAVVVIAAFESSQTLAPRLPELTIAKVLDDDDWMRDVRAGRFFKKSSPSRSSYTRNYGDEVTPYGRGSRSNLGRPPSLDELRPRRPSKPRVLRSSATYRTVCVRACDGAFFPISTSTTRDRFEKDEAACKSQCDVPARLYVYRTIGGSPETMVDIKGRPYEKQPNAFLFRTKYVAECKCRPNPWDKAARDRHASYTTKAWQRKARQIARVNRYKAKKQRHKVRALRRWLEKNGAAVAQASVVTPPPHVRPVVRASYRPRAAKTTLGGNTRGSGSNRNQKQTRRNLRTGRMGLGAGKTGRETRRNVRRSRNSSVPSRLSGWQGRVQFGTD